MDKNTRKSKNEDGKLPIHGVISRFDREEFEAKYLAKPSKESIEKYERAFKARLAYEKNCIAKYDYPDWMKKPSRPIPRGERMEDFAFKFGADVNEMRKHELEWAVERGLANGL